jgi:Mg/Co/Ni transporter MgtE
VLGPMPTGHVVTMLRASPPGRAVNALLSMPKDRIDRLLAAMDGPLIARLIIAAAPPRRAALLSHLGDERLAAELALMPLLEAGAVLAVLPADRAGAQANRINPDRLASLLDTVPENRREKLVETLEPGRRLALQRVDFEKGVIEALRRTGATLQWVPGDRGANLLAGAFQGVFGVSLWHVDGETLPVSAVFEARRVFAGIRVRGLLLVTNADPPMLVPPAHDGVPALVVRRNPGDNDGVLGRALVRLAT